MTKPQQVIVLDPSNEISFKGPFTEYVNATLTLSNPSRKDVYFKVKTTAPKFYCVRPNSGMIKANDKTQINVMLQPVESPEALENERSRHKFMIQTAFAPDDDDGEYPPVDKFWKSVDPTSVMDSKLRVVFQRPFEFSDETNREETDVTDTFGTSYNKTAESKIEHPAQTPKIKESNSGDLQLALQREIDLRMMYQDEKKSLEEENYALIEKLEKVTHNAAADGGFPQENVQILHAVLFAVLALMIGLIIGKLI